MSVIIKQQVTTKFKKGNFEAGILAGTKSLIKEIGTDIEKPVANISQATENKVNSQPFYEKPLTYLLWILIPVSIIKFIFFQ